MKPTTIVPALALRFPGQVDKLKEIASPVLGAQKFTEHPHGLIIIESIPCGDALKLIMQLILGISLTNAMHITIHKSVDEAMRAHIAKDSDGMPTNKSGIDFDQVLASMLADPQYHIKDDELMFENPDVTGAQFDEAAASLEYQEAYKYRHADMRQTISQDELNRIWKAYADKYPNVAAHDPKWT